MLRDVAPKAKNGATGRARQLRREMTLPEVLLWQELRKRPRGLKFRRQHPSGAYILDFYCNDAGLAVEIDGEVHGRGTAPNHDARRNSWFEAHGIFTLRISARAVLDNLESVLIAIIEAAVARLPLHHPSGGPPPPDKLGEEF